MAVIDKSALERIDKVGGADLVGKMIDIFLTNVPQRLATAREGQQRGDFKAIEQAVHSIKSSAGNMGADALQELAGRIEALAETRQGDGIPLLLNELEEILGQVIHRLETEKEGLQE